MRPPSRSPSTSVSTDLACTDPASTPAANGHLIAVQVQVTTGPDLSAVGGEPAIRAADFRFLGRTASPSPMPASPAPTPAFPTPSPSRPAPSPADQELTGIVVLDVPATTGTLVFSPDFLTVGAEWAY